MFFFLSSLIRTKKLFIFFVILVSRAEILGNSEVFIKSGNDINLTCVAYDAPGPPSFIYWYKGPSVINYSQRGGISVLTERQTKTSKLVISRAMSSDSGNYTCLPSNSGMFLTCFLYAVHTHTDNWLYSTYMSLQKQAKVVEKRKVESQKMFLFFTSFEWSAKIVFIKCLRVTDVLQAHKKILAH